MLSLPRPPPAHARRYAAPELQSSLLRNAPLVATPALDVWSLGVVLFELCTGRTLFRQDISNDDMVEEADMTRLATWLCVDDAALAAVFVKNESDNSAAQCTATQRSVRLGPLPPPPPPNRSRPFSPIHKRCYCTCPIPPLAGCETPHSLAPRRQPRGASHAARSACSSISGGFDRTPAT